MPLLQAVSDNIWAYRRDMLYCALRLIMSEPLMSLVYLNALLLTGPAHQKAEKRLSTLQDIVFGIWGMPARTVKELRSEVEASGFRAVREIPVPATRLFPIRGFLLVHRPQLVVEMNPVREPAAFNAAFFDLSYTLREYSTAIQYLKEHVLFTSTDNSQFLHCRSVADPPTYYNAPVKKRC